MANPRNLSDIRLHPARVEALRISAGNIEPTMITQSWDQIFNWARQDGHAGVLYWRIQRENQWIVPAETREKLQQTSETIRDNFIYRECCWAEVLHALHRESITAICLKGHALDRTVYPQPGLRNMCDFDVLVQPDKIHKALSALYNIGYRNEHWKDPLVKDFLLNENIAIDLDQPLWPIVDLHHSLTVEVDPRATQDVLRQAKPGLEQNEYLPDPAHLLFHIMHHGVRSGSGFKLIWPLDVWFLLQKYAMTEELLHQVADVAIQWQSPLFIVQAGRELKALLGLETGILDEILVPRLRLPERIIAKGWRRLMNTKLDPTLKIAHRLARRPVTGTRTGAKLMFPSPGHTVLLYNIESQAPQFWKFRIRDYARRLKMAKIWQKSGEIPGEK